MTKFVVSKGHGVHQRFLTPRRATGRQYEDRSGWEFGIENAKVFQTKGAASNSAKRNGAEGWELLPVAVVVIESDQSMMEQAVKEYIAHNEEQDHV